MPNWLIPSILQIYRIGEQFLRNALDLYMLCREEEQKKERKKEKEESVDGMNLLSRF
ncbi:hypothetical protein Hanom_Chr10g00913261 [Helianthus anomalus]